MTKFILKKRALENFSQIKKPDYGTSHFHLTAQVSRIIIIFTLGATLAACSSARSQRELVDEMTPETVQPTVQQQAEASPDGDEEDAEYSELDAADDDDDDDEDEGDAEDEESDFVMAEPEFFPSPDEGRLDDRVAEIDAHENGAELHEDESAELGDIQREHEFALVDQSIAANNLASLDSSAGPPSEVSPETESDDAPDAPANEVSDEEVTMARIIFAGSWSAAEPSGTSCRITLSMADTGNALSASTSGCTNPQLASVSAWDLRGDTVVLYGAGQGVAARLLAAPGAMSGLITESGQPLALSR
ncbi:MAG: AprI/Inh family metalloprotease inhibitor [Salinarimonas sp.]|nr:AprI/Inh family metalloprotease inhibitor [Salinarimonas sp.]